MIASSTAPKAVSRGPSGQPSRVTYPRMKSGGTRGAGRRGGGGGGVLGAGGIGGGGGGGICGRYAGYAGGGGEG